MAEKRRALLTRFGEFRRFPERAKNNPGDSRAHELLAEAALASQDEAEGLPVVEAAARRFSTNARLWQWTGLLYRALDDRLAAIPRSRTQSSWRPMMFASRTVMREFSEAGHPLQRRLSGRAIFRHRTATSCWALAPPGASGEGDQAFGNWMAACAKSGLPGTILFSFAGPGGSNGFVSSLERSWPRCLVLVFGVADRHAHSK